MFDPKNRRLSVNCEFIIDTNTGFNPTVVPLDKRFPCAGVFFFLLTIFLCSCGAKVA